MGLGIPPLNINIMLESNPPESGILVRGLAVMREVLRVLRALCAGVALLTPHIAPGGALTPALIPTSSRKLT